MSGGPGSRGGCLVCPVWRVKSSNSLPVTTDQVLDFAAVPFQLWGMWGRGQWVGVEQPGGFGRDVSVVGGLVCVYVWPPSLYFGDIYY